MGRDARARGYFSILGPGMDFYRVPMGGRNFEYMTGEDPYLGAQLVPPLIKGVQAQGVWACAKHFACNDEEENRTNVQILLHERTLREIYLPPFEAENALKRRTSTRGDIVRRSQPFQQTADNDGEAHRRQSSRGQISESGQPASRRYSLQRGDLCWLSRLREESGAAALSVRVRAILHQLCFFRFEDCAGQIHRIGRG
jgi:hypothetical protein